MPEYKYECSITPKKVREAVEKIRSLALVVRDYEAAHAAEDALHSRVLLSIAADACWKPKKCARLAYQTLHITFSRRYA